MGCIFCKKPNVSDIICQTKHWVVLLSYDQAYLGRCIVSLNRHCDDLAKLKENEWEDFIYLVKKLEGALRKSFNATMFNWTCLMNDAYKEKNPEPHVHWHLRPRYSHKMEIAGLVFEDLEFGHHYNRGTERKVPDGVKKIIISRIKGNL